MIIDKSQSTARTLAQRAQHGARQDFDTPTWPLRSRDQVDVARYHLGLVGAAEETTPYEVDAHAEDAYWAEHYRDSPYVPAGTPYDHVRAAYRFGWESCRRLPDVSWNIALPRLRSEWNADPANFMMTWAEAERAVQDAWNHAGAPRSH